jgi:hypothetical protein
VATLVGVAGVLFALFLITVQPRINSEGATDAEHHGTWPGDELVSDPSFTWTNAITIDAPAAKVWPWVNQLGQGRGGLYSYDWLENAVFADIHSTDEILPEFQAPLSVGDKAIRMAQYAPYNPVALYEPGRALVLGDVNDTPEELKAGHASSTWAFIVEPIDADSSRLIVRSRGSSFSIRAQGPFQFVMQRKMMQGIEQRAEGRDGTPALDILEPLSWFVAAAVGVASAGLFVIRQERWLHALTMTVAAALMLGYLLFWQPPFPIAIAADCLLLIGLVATRLNLLQVTKMHGKRVSSSP